MAELISTDNPRVSNVMFLWFHSRQYADNASAAVDRLLLYAAERDDHARHRNQPREGLHKHRKFRRTWQICRQAHPSDLSYYRRKYVTISTHIIAGVLNKSANIVEVLCWSGKTWSRYVYRSRTVNEWLKVNVRSLKCRPFFVKEYFAHINSSVL